jgi:hypothetical protein
MRWPELTLEGTLDELLASQLIAWGLITLGESPPDDFVEWLDEVSKLTGVYTAVECMDKAEEVLHKRKYLANQGVM